MSLISYTKKNFNQKVFNFVHKNHLIYNQCWEDPALDRQAMSIKTDDKILMITSAGCNALDYLLDNPKKITTVDVNPKQTALLDLKISGIRNLGFDDFFQIFGKGSCDKFKDIYYDSLRKDLPQQSKNLWDKNITYFNPKSWRKSFYYHGASGVAAYILIKYLKTLRLTEEYKKIFEAKNLKEQKEIYFSKIHPILFNKSLKYLVNNTAFMSLLGVPKSQMSQLEMYYHGGLFSFIKNFIEVVSTKIPARNNYFWWLYFFGEYSKKTCPNYLKEKNFKILKDRVEKINNVTKSLADELKDNNEKYSKFVLLDHMDWLYKNRTDLLQKEWQSIADKSESNCQIIWRSASPKVNFVDDLKIYSNGHVDNVGKYLSYDNLLAKRLHKKDRVHTYASFYIAHLKKEVNYV